MNTAKFSKRENNVLAEQYIVVLSEKVKSEEVQAIAEELARKHQGTLGHVYRSAIKGFSVKLPTAAQARALSRDARIEYIEEDGIISVRDRKETEESEALAPEALRANPCLKSLPPGAVSSPQTLAPRHLIRLNHRQLSAAAASSSFTFNGRGTGVNIYVVDTGVYVEHEEFRDKNNRPRAFRAKRANGVIFDATQDAIVDPKSRGLDQNGHGTQVASLIAGRTVGVAKNATIYSVKVLNSGNFGTFSNFMAGVDYVFRQAIKPAIANLSLGQLASEDMKAARSLETAVSNLIASGITCVVAAPNLLIDAALESPGRFADCLTVGSSNSLTDVRDGGFGAGIDIFAPGLNVCAAVSFDDRPPNTSMLNTISGGTSTAASLVTGVAALFLEKNPSATPAQVMEAIKTNATRDVLKNIPAGTKNRLLFSSFI